MKEFEPFHLRDKRLNIEKCFPMIKLSAKFESYMIWKNSKKAYWKLSFKLVFFTIFLVFQYLSSEKSKTQNFLTFIMYLRWKHIDLAREQFLQWQNNGIYFRGKFLMDHVPSDIFKCKWQFLRAETIFQNF